MATLPPIAWAWTPGTLVSRGRGSDAALCERMVRAAAAARAGGIDGLLLREPFLHDGVTLDLARRLRDVFDGAWFGVHDRVHLASHVDADGVHLGGASLSIHGARALVGPDVAIGVSTHAGDGVDAVRGADFAVHGPLAAPNSKSSTRESLGNEGLASFSAECPVPVWALGGIDATRLAELPPAVRGGAFIGALWGTGAEPVDTRPAPLDDVRSIEERARELAAAAQTLERSARA